MLSKIGLIGYGYWGKKLARTLNNLGVLASICDSNTETLGKAKDDIGDKVTLFTDYHTMFETDIDGVVIATPPDTHYSIAKESIESFLHTFVEKPLATVSKEAEQLVALSMVNNVSLKTGYIYLHCPGLLAIPRPVGKCEIYIKLLNPGGPPSERDILWAGLPHALSVVNHWIPDLPDYGVLGKSDRNRIQVRLDYWDSSTAYIDTADYINIRMRRVELRCGNEKWIFDADTPYKNSRSTVDVTTPDPLTLEMQDFLKGEGIDQSAVKVSKLLDMVQDGIRKERGEGI